MRLLFIALALSCILFGPVRAASVIPLTAPFDDFDTTPAGGGNDSANRVRIDVDGTVFTLTAVAKFFGTPFFIGTTEPVGTGARTFGISGRGLEVGGGGNSLTRFGLSVSEDVTFTGYGITAVLGRSLGFDLRQAGTTLSAGNPINVTGDFLLAGGPVTLAAGSGYEFRITGTGFAALSAFTELRFEPVATPVPLPAGLPMAIAGLLALIGLRRRAGLAAVARPSARPGPAARRGSRRP